MDAGELVRTASTRREHPAAGRVCVRGLPGPGGCTGAQASGIKPPAASSVPISRTPSRESQADAEPRFSRISHTHSHTHTL